MSRRKRKIPLRKCIVCEEMKPKQSLLRIVRTPEQEVRWDPTGKLSGRGAYLCLNEACVYQAEERKALERALKTQIDQSVYEMLKQEINELKTKEGSHEP